MRADRERNAVRDGTRDVAGTPQARPPQAAAVVQVLQRSAGNTAVTRRLQRQGETAQQRKVLGAARWAAAERSHNARKALLKVAKRHGLTPADLEVIKAHIRKAELTINFEASKVIPSLNMNVAELLERSGEIKNMFETGTSGGSADFQGREGVERNLFGYKEITPESSMAEKAERPRYAAVNATTSAGGGADTSSYGLSSLVLNDAARERATLTATDTFGHKPEDVGTFDSLDHVLLQKLSDSEGKDFAETILAHARGQRASTKGFGYMEAQIHGSINLERDVAYVRASFNEGFGTKAGEAMMRLANTKPVVWAYYKKRDQMVLQPTKGPAARHFQDKWDEVKQDRLDAEAAGAPIPTVVPSKILTDRWNELLALMPPANIDVFDDKRKDLGQLSGRKPGDDLPTISAKEVKELLGKS